VNSDVSCMSSDVKLMPIATSTRYDGCRTLMGDVILLDPAADAVFRISGGARTGADVLGDTGILDPAAEAAAVASICGGTCTGTS